MSGNLRGYSSSERTLDERQLAAWRPAAVPAGPRASSAPPPVREDLTLEWLCAFCDQRFGADSAQAYAEHADEEAESRFTSRQLDRYRARRGRGGGSVCDQLALAALITGHGHPCSFCGGELSDGGELAAHVRQEQDGLLAFIEGERESRRRSTLRWRENGGRQYDKKRLRNLKLTNPEAWRERKREQNARWRQRRRERRRAAGWHPAPRPRPTADLLQAAEGYVTGRQGCIARPAEVAAELGISSKVAGALLLRLANAGRITKVGPGLYAVYES